MKFASSLSIVALIAQLAVSNAATYSGSYETVNGDSGWQYVLSFQDPDGIGSNVDYGSTDFNSLFWQSAEHILLVRIYNWNNPIKEYVYYKRYTCLSSLDLYYLTNDWMSSDGQGCGNILGTDFDLFSSLADAQAGTNAWGYCNYNDPNVGMFRDCGPTGWTGNWNMAGNGNKNGPKPAKFYIYAPEQEGGCAAYGLTLSTAHACTCQAQCDGATYCNSAAYVASRLGASLTATEAAALCPSSALPTCCCSCNNCATYIAA